MNDGIRGHRGIRTLQPMIIFVGLYIIIIIIIP